MSSCKESLTKDGSVFMPHKNPPKLLIEIYKVINGLTSNIFKNVFFKFQMENQYNLRKNSTLRIPSFDTRFKKKKMYPTQVQRYGSKYQKKQNL